MTQTSAGFRPVGTISGAPIRYQDFLAKDTETLTAGDLANLESNEVDLGATNDVAFVGIIQKTVSAVDSTTLVSVTTNPDIIFAVYDPTARAMGDLLDLAGATGAQTVAAASNNDFRVFASKTAAEPETFLIFAHGEHILN